jgi:hypothetical protein
MTAERRLPDGEAALESAGEPEKTVRRITWLRLERHDRPVVPYIRHRDASDSVARLAGELAAARVQALEALRLTEKCWECAALGVDELRRSGWIHGGCPHLEVAS